MSEAVRLPKKDWETLDDILGRHGFGGYYDLVECLKNALVKVARLEDPAFCADDVKDLPTVVRAIMEAADSAYADMVDAEIADDTDPPAPDPDLDPCPECGDLVPEDRETCPNCGHHEFLE